MKTKMIKDPMFNIYAKGGNVENRNKELKKDDLIKLAKDEQDILFDIENEITGILLENYNKEKKPGQSFLDWLDTKPKSYFQKIPLGMKEGGEVIDFLSYLKQKEKPRVKRLNLDSVAPGKALSELTEAEREVVRNLLRMSFKD